MNRLPALILVLALADARAGDDLPEGSGLSARYRGDVGIAGDPAVLLAEDFEKGTIDDLGKK